MLPIYLTDFDGCNDYIDRHFLLENMLFQMHLGLASVDSWKYESEVNYVEIMHLYVKLGCRFV